jgi:hypothetical protein
VAYCQTNGLKTDAPPADRSERNESPRDAPRGPSRSALASFDLFDRRASLEDVAAKLGRARSTVGGYLQDYLIEKQIDDPTPWVAAEQRAQIEDAIGHVGAERLKPIFDHLGGTVDYDTIRIVATCWNHRVRHEAPLSTSSDPTNPMN